MTKVEATDRGNNFGLTGNIGKAYEYGERIYGDVFYGNEETYPSASEYGLKEYGAFQYGEEKSKWGIYQRRHNKGKVVYAKLKFYIPKNNQKPGQQSWRGVFINGMTAWRNLTSEQKAVYNKRAKEKHLHGVNLFLREYLKSN